MLVHPGWQRWQAEAPISQRRTWSHIEEWKAINAK